MKIKKPFSSLKTALWLCAAAFLLAVVIYPEIFLQRGISFANWDDYLIDYQSTFMITGFFYQGGIQLWDYFGQVPHAFLWVTHGMFRLPNLLTSAAYILLSPFTDNSAQFFDRVFSIVYIGSLMGIRVMGIFLLLKRLTEDKWILRVCPVIFAIFFSPGFMFGTYYQSFFPLLMYFILSFFLTGRPLYLGLTALFMIFLFVCVLLL